MPNLPAPQADVLSKSALSKKPKQELIALCRSLGLPCTRRNKAELVLQLLSPAESMRERLTELVHLQLIKEHRQQLVKHAERVYPLPQAGTAAASGTSPGHTVFDLLRSLDTKIDITATQRLVVALYGPMGEGKTFAINEIVMRGMPEDDNDRSGDDGLLLGQRGPLPSNLVQQDSLTVAPTRLRLSRSGDHSLQLRTTFKQAIGSGARVSASSSSVQSGGEGGTSACSNVSSISSGNMQSSSSGDGGGGDPAGTVNFGPLSWSSLAHLRAHILALRDTQAQNVLELEVTAPFPGLLLLEQAVRDQLAERDRDLFVGVELVDLPGSGDDLFARQQQREVLAACDIICFTPSTQRGVSSSDVVGIVKAGALPSYERRCKLVLFVNLKPDRHEQAATHSYMQLQDDGRLRLRQTIESLLQTASSASTQDINDSQLALNRATLADLLRGSPQVHVTSPAEGEALMRKASDECSALVFYSQQLERKATKLGWCSGFISTNVQLQSFLLQELNSRVRYSRMYPLLDDLQKMGQLIKRKMAIYIHSNPSQSEYFAHQLTQAFAKEIGAVKASATQRLKLKPVLRFDHRRLRTLSFMVDVQALLDQGKLDELQQLLRQPACLHQLLAEALQVLEDSFRTLFSCFDNVVDRCIQNTPGVLNEVGEEAQKGFLCPAVSIALKDKLAELEPGLRIALNEAVQRCVRPLCKLTKEVREAMHLLDEEMPDAQDGEDDDDSEAGEATDVAMDEEEVDVDEKDEKANNEAREVNKVDGSDERLPAQLLVCLLLHQALDWKRVNSLTHNRRHSPTRAQLEDAAQFVQATYCVQLTGLFERRAADASEPSTLSVKDAKHGYDDIDRIVRQVRLAMREFNPAFSFEDGDADAEARLDSAKHLPDPKRYDAPRKRVDADICIGELDRCFIKTKQLFRLSKVHSLLRLQTKSCIYNMVRAGLEPDAGRRKLRDDGDKRSQRWAAALARGAVDLLDLPLGDLRDETRTALTKVETVLLEVAKSALWYLRRSRLQMTLNVAESAEHFGLAEPFRPTMQTLMAGWLAAGEDVIVIERQLSQGLLSATLAAPLLERLRRLATPAGDELCPIIIPSFRCGPGDDGSDVASGNLWLDGQAGDERYDDEARAALGLEGKPATVIVLCEPRNVQRFVRNFGQGSQAASSHRNTRLVWALLPMSRAGFGVAMSIGKLLAEALSFSRYWTLDDDLKAVHQWDNPGRWFLASLRRCLVFGQRVLRHTTEECFRCLRQEDVYECAEVGADATTTLQPSAQKALRKQLFSLLSALQEADADGLLRDPELLIQRQLVEAGPSEYAAVKALSQPEWLVVRSAMVREVEQRGRENLDSIAGVSISHARNKRLGYVHKGTGGNYRRSNQRYQCVLHNAAALIGRNLVPDETLLAHQPWHDLLSDDIPAAWALQLKAYRRDSRNGCKTADHQFTRGLDGLGTRGYQVFNFAHLRLEFKQDAHMASAYESTDAESMAGEREDELDDEDD